MVGSVSRGLKKKVGSLRYGVIHSQFGFSDGVSVVMDQIDNVLSENLKVPKENILYLVGKSKEKLNKITENDILWDRNKINLLMLSRFEKGYGGRVSEKIEGAINEAREVIEDFVLKNKIDVLIVHNSSHPVNFVSSVALSRYYRDSIAKRKKTPKYVLWWHDSHLERAHFSNPAADVERYLLEGVPGRFVEYVLFINHLQFREAKKYFERIDRRHPGFLEAMSLNHGVVYNTTDVFIKRFKDLERNDNNVKLKEFLKSFGVRGLLRRNGLGLKNVMFCLQHTRVLERKRIDFALKYCYELLGQAKKRDFKAVYFLVSGESGSDGSRKRIEALNGKLMKEYGGKLFLVFAEDYYNKTSISFGDYPRLFAQLGGFSTYFSEVEGFGNNLLEVLASGLIPVIYKYPVFKSDIEKWGFDLLALDDFDVRREDLKDLIKLMKNKKMKARMVENNLKVLKRCFPHKVMASKLVEAICKKRLHI